MMKFNDGGDIEAMMAQMAGGQQPQQPQGGGGETAFIMPGQEASPIQIDQERRDQAIEPHQFVIFSGPEGEEVQVYGDWETYGSPNQEGMISDEDYPISRGEDGEYVLNSQEFEAGMTAGDSEAAMAGQAQGGPGASKTQDLMEMLSDAGGPPQMRNGGVVKAYAGGGSLRDKPFTNADLTKSILEYENRKKAYADGGELESESGREQRQAVRAIRRKKRHDDRGNPNRDRRRRNRFVTESISTSSDTGEFLEKLGGPGINKAVNTPYWNKTHAKIGAAMAALFGTGTLLGNLDVFGDYDKYGNPR